MRKIIAPIIAILVLAGTAYAAFVVGLFPDTPSFPRIPSALGTIGSAISRMLGGADLANYIGDGGNGTVTNSEKLGKVSATGYLQHNTCDIRTGDVWLGIDPSGVPLCGPKGSLLAMEIGTLTGVTGTVTITKPDSTSTSGVNGNMLYAGDILSTAGSSSGTIAFVDASIIRLDELTTVELTGGTNSSGATIAQVILNDGNLWGRVLTSTGINFEAGGYIAGVRGTSISVKKTDPTHYAFFIVDSTIPTNSAATFTNTNPGATGGPISVGSGSQVTVPAIGGTAAASAISTPKSILLGDSWIASNTLIDMSYLLAAQQDQSLSLPIQNKILDEFNVTVPSSDDAGEKGSLGLACDSTDPLNIPSWLPPISPGSLPEDIENQKIAFKELCIHDMNCKNQGNSIFWSTIEKCVPPIGGGTATSPLKRIIWMADYTRSGPYGSFTSELISAKGKLIVGKQTSTPLALMGRTLTTPITGYYTGTTSGLEIFTGGYIQYSPIPSDLAGKTVTIELMSAIPITPGDKKHYVLDFGGGAMLTVFKKGNDWACGWTLLKPYCGGAILESSDGKTITVKLPTSYVATQMIIGNNFADKMNPIGTIIQKISIFN